MKVDEVRRIIAPILRKMGVKKAGLFGSLVREEDNPESDVDVLVEVDDSVSLLGLAHLKNELENKLGRSVDLVEYNTIKPAIKKQILREQVAVI